MDRSLRPAPPGLCLYSPECVERGVLRRWDEKADPPYAVPLGSAAVRRALGPNTEGGSALEMDGSKEQPNVTAGLDLGDKRSYLCLIDHGSAEVMEEGRLRATPEAFRRRFASERPMRASR